MTAVPSAASMVALGLRLRSRTASSCCVVCVTRCDTERVTRPPLTARRLVAQQRTHRAILSSLSCLATILILCAKRLSDPRRGSSPDGKVRRVVVSESLAETRWTPRRCRSISPRCTKRPPSLMQSSPSTGSRFTSTGCVHRVGSRSGRPLAQCARAHDGVAVADPKARALSCCCLPCRLSWR